MTRWLKQSTAKTLRFGPFLDETDGKTAETALTISQADIRLSKNGGAFAQTNDVSGATHDENGWYSLQLDATDTNTLGPLTVAIHESGALPAWEHFMVVPANEYDSLVSGTDALQVDIVQCGGSALAGTLFNGITSLAEWLGLVAGKQTGDSTARTELRATGAGSGTFDETTDSLEAVRDTAPLGTAMRGTDNAALAATALTNATWTDARAGYLDALNGHTAQTGDNFARLGAPAGASVSADIAAVKTDTGNLVNRITATLFSGITSLAQWLGLLAGKQSGNATARTELRATGAGSGTFDETSDSLEAIRDTVPMGTAMRGTDNAALATICTETRLAELDAANLPADVDQIKGDLPSRITKNVALNNFMFLMIDSADHITGKTGLTVTAQRSIDGAAFASCANAVSEVSNGIYKINLAAADLNGNVITLLFTATGADARLITIVTQP